jgi:hypothetical protein
LRVAAFLLTAGAVLGSGARADALGLPSRAWQTASASPAVAHGWAWQVQRKGAPALGAVSGIPSGDLAVAWLGQPDKMSYLGIGGAGSASLTGATLELPVDPDAPNLQAEGAQIRACLIVLEWEPAAPMPWDGKPPTVCDTSAPGRYDASSEVFAFDLDPMADALASAAVHGISIEPVESPQSSFQVAFKAESIQLRLPAPRSGPTTEAPAPAPVAVGEELAAYAPQPPGPQVSPPARTVPPSTAVAAAAPPRTSQRPVSLSAVYAMLALLAGLALGGRVVANVLRSKREDEV